MYKINDISWEKYSNISHQKKYFIYQWSHLLSPRTLELERIPLIGIRGMLKELLSLFDLCEKKIIHITHLEKLANEIYVNLKNNDVIKEYYKEDYQLIIDLLYKISEGKKNSIKNTLYYISSFSKKLNENYYTYNINYLINKLNNDTYPYDRIDILTEQLLTDLSFQGYSTTYLFNWGLEVFVYGENPSFENRINKLKNLEKESKENYNCIFILRAPTQLLTIDTNDYLNFYHNKNDIKLNTLQLSYIEELNANQKYALIKTSAMDKYTALDSAHLQLLNLVKLYQISNPTYEPNIMGKAIVYNDYTTSELKIEKKLYNIKINNNLFNFIEKYISKNNNYNKESLEVLNKVLHWCRIANESPLESKFLSLWTALESLLCSNNNGKIPSIINYTSSFIGIYYPRRLLLELWFKIKNNISQIPNKYMDDIIISQTASTGKNYINVVDFFHLILGNGNEFINHFDNDFIIRNLRWLKISLGEKKLFYKKLLLIEDQVQNDIRRLYRLRNLLVHQAHVGEEDLIIYTKKLLFYLEVILRKILYSFDNNIDHTIIELLISKEATYDNLKNNLKNNCYPEIKPKDILYPQNLLSI